MAAQTVHMKSLEGKIAVVAGGSRGAGRGIALALGEAGAIVYVAARTSKDGPKPSDGAPGTVEETAAMVTARGGEGIPVPADLSEKQQVAALFERIKRERRRLDILANSAWGADCMAVWSKRFWELEIELWQETLRTVSVGWLTSVYAARLMVKQGQGLIVHVDGRYIPIFDPKAPVQEFPC